MRKLIIITILIFLVAALMVGCTSLGLPDEPPELSITIGDKKIEYVVGKNIWNKAIYDREDTFQSILKEGSGIEIPIVYFGELVKIKFKDNPPDKLIIHDILIDKNGNQFYSDKVINTIQVELNNGECSFEINKHMASYLSSVYEKDKIDYRGFRMIASWGENECEYGFIVGTKENTNAQEISKEERQRMELYIEVMKAAFSEENGGDSFIAVKLDTLEGLNDDAKAMVLEELKSLSPNVYQLEDIENDSTRFEMDSNGMLMRTLDGTLLWIELKEYSEDKAEITGVSWFGNLGAVFPTYEAIYKNGVWKLKLISMAVSSNK